MKKINKRSFPQAQAQTRTQASANAKAKINNYI